MIKFKVLHGRPIRGSVFGEKSKKGKKKREGYKSLDLREGESIEYRSLPVKTELDELSLKLPKIKRSK